MYLLNLVHVILLIVVIAQVVYLIVFVTSVVILIIFKFLFCKLISKLIEFSM